MKNKLYEMWVSSPSLGRIKKTIYQLLRKKYNFREWHLSPVNEREYAVYVLRLVNELIQNEKMPCGSKIIEIGCGMGEIIGNVRLENNRRGYSTVGYDIQKQIILPARMMHPWCKFIYGSFGKIRNQKIGCLIMVNFLQGIPSDEVNLLVQSVFQNNTVKYIIVDSVQGEGYPYEHNFEKIFGQEYKLKKSRCFPANKGKRRVALFCKAD